MVFKKVKIYADIRHSLHSRYIDSINVTRIKLGRSWMANSDTKRNSATTIYVILREIEWIPRGFNNSQVIISVGNECSVWCDGRADLEVIDPQR